MATGYDELDNLQTQTNQLYDEQMKQQESMINTSTQQAIDEIERNKQKAQQEVDKTNRTLYTDYQKQINPYGVNAENLAEQGLARSGLAETTKANYYNTYQTARTEAMNNANTIKADFDAEIVKARQNGDLQKAQALFNLYSQKINDLSNMYNLKFQADQFAYQKEQDALSQSNWEREFEQALQQAQWEQAFNQSQFDYQKDRDIISDSQWNKEFGFNQDQFDYQKQQDKLAQSNWEKEFALAKKKSSSGSSGGSNSLIVSDNNTKNINVSDNTANSNNKKNNDFNIEEYSFDKSITNIISSTEPNSTPRQRILKGYLKTGAITQSEYDYLMNIK